MPRDLLEQATRQLLRAVRGDRSQLAFSRLLGYRSNPVAQWETGRRFPFAADALRACERSGVDVRAALVRFHAPSAAAFTLGDRGLAAWLDVLRGSTPISVLARRIRTSRSTASRWLSGASRFRVPDLLRLVQAVTGRVADFVGELVPIERVPVLQPLRERTLAAERLSREQPWAAAVLHLMETRAYRGLRRHQEGWIARCLGIDLETERAIVRDLLRARIVVRRGKCLVTSGELRIYGAPPGARKLHWSRVAAKRLSRPRDGDLFSYAVLSLSRAGLVRLRARLLNLFRETLAEVAADPDPEAVALLNLQLLGWDPATLDPPAR